MEHVARAVVRHRKLVLVIAVLLLIPSLMGALLTGTNYDILTYLPDELDSMKGEQSLENDFHIAATGLVTCEGMPQSDIDALADKIAAVPGVRKVISVSSLLDESVPAGMLPDELQKVAAGKNNAKLMIVLFDEAAASESTMDACKTIRTELTEQSFFGGMSMRKGATPREAGRVAVDTCSQSILTSGLTFFAATFGVSLISRMELLRSLCLLVSRGAIISMLVIIYVLPCLLILLEKVIEKTSRHWLTERPSAAEKVKKIKAMRRAS